MAEVLGLTNVMKDKGFFSLNAEDGIINSGFYYNWTSGVDGITTLEVINVGGNILQRETNPSSASYCRIRLSTDNGVSWGAWKLFTLS